MGFSRQEYWSELPFPPPGDLPPTQELNRRFPVTLTWQEDLYLLSPLEALYTMKKKKLFLRTSVGSNG